MQVVDHAALTLVAASDNVQKANGIPNLEALAFCTGVDRVYIADTFMTERYWAYIVGSQVHHEV